MHIKATLFDCQVQRTLRVHRVYCSRKYDNLSSYSCQSIENNRLDQSIQL
jgi:hypothetical protein